MGICAAISKGIDATRRTLNRSGQGVVSRTTRKESSLKLTVGVRRLPDVFEQTDGGSDRGGGGTGRTLRVYLANPYRSGDNSILQAENHFEYLGEPTRCFTVAHIWLH